MPSQYGIGGSYVAQQAGSVTALKREVLPSQVYCLAMLKATAAFYVLLPRGHATPK